MPRFDVSKVRYTTPEEWRILQGTELGMKSNALVPMGMVASLANLKRSGAHKIIKDLSQKRMIAWEKAKAGKIYGYRLTWSGYDYLAFRALNAKGVVASVGKQIGVGKESDIYLAQGRDLEELEREADKKRINSQTGTVAEVTSTTAQFVVDVDDLENVKEVAIKIHRLGRTSFRNIKNTRDYHGGRTHISWIYLSRLSATREYAFQKCLHDRGFSVPKPLGVNRHMVIMELVRGLPLTNCRVEKLLGHEIELFNQCMDIVVNLAKNGIVHGDLNEFNLMCEDHDEFGEPCEPKIVMIDFPQMIPVTHKDAEDQFYRDVKGICAYWKLKFELELDVMPNFQEIISEQKQLEVDNQELISESGEAEIVDVMSWKMNLMETARRVGNDAQGGWAPMPSKRREDYAGGDSEEESGEEEEDYDDFEEENNHEIPPQDQKALDDLEAEIDALEPSFNKSSPKPKVIAEPVEEKKKKESERESKNEEEDGEVSEVFAKRMAAIRTGMTEITGSTSLAPELIKFRVKKAMELAKYRTKSGKLAKADKTSVKNRRMHANDVRQTMRGSSAMD